MRWIGGEGGEGGGGRLRLWRRRRGEEDALNSANHDCNYDDDDDDDDYHYHYDHIFINVNS